MLYKINDTFYLKVDGHYVGVEITIQGDDLDIKPTSNKIEIASVKEPVRVFDMRVDKDTVIDLVRSTQGRRKNTEFEMSFDDTPRRISRSKR